MLDSLILSKITLNQTLIVFSALLIPIKPLLLIVALCISIDTAFGIIASMKENKKITSRGLSAIVGKMFLYEGSVLLVFLLEKYLVGDFVIIFTAIPLFLTKIVSTILVGIEVLSIAENLERGFGINVWSEARLLLTRAKDAKHEIDDALDDVKETKCKIDSLK